MIRSIDKEKCVGCGICVERCPLDTLRLGADKKHISPIQKTA